MQINKVDKTSFAQLHVDKTVRKSVREVLTNNSKLKPAFDKWDVNVIQVTSGINETKLTVSNLDKAKKSNLGKTVSGFVLSTLMFYINDKKKHSKDFIANFDGDIVTNESGSLNEVDDKMVNFVKSLDSYSFDAAVLETQMRRENINAKYKESQENKSLSVGESSLSEENSKCVLDMLNSIKDSIKKQKDI